MKSVQSLVALFSCLLAAWPMAAQQPPARMQSQDPSQPSVMDEQPSFWGRFTQPYKGRLVGPIHLDNSGRIESLMRAGQIYLSLADAVALALENNIDIEVQRYAPRLAEADLLRARAGSGLRGVSTQTTSGASTSSVQSGQNTSSTGSSVSNVSQQLSATSLQINLDPVLTGTLQWAHRSSPQTNTVTTGITSVVSTNKTNNVSVSQGFLSGTSYQLNFNNFNQAQNSPANAFNPSTTAALDLQVNQHLLQGFGFAVNNRNIRVAKNNLKVADLTFQLQVINTVSNVISQYWSLVSYYEDVNVKRQALGLSQKLYEDNKKQVEIGTLAPIEVIRAEAEVASRQQDLTTSETNVLQQETILKSFLSRTGSANPAIASARIVPTDRIQIPDVEPIQPIQDMMGVALDKRPELAQSRIQLDNSRILLTGTKNALLPTIDAIAGVSNGGLAGQVNTIPIPPGTNFSRSVDPFFIGGYGTALGQIFSRNFPNYSIGLQLNIPLRNRSSQADFATAQLNLRQSELQVQKQVNNVRVDVQNALIAMQQARARYLAAQKNRILQEQTLDAEQKKYALGASTQYLVIQSQRDLATAKGQEVAALAAYAQARTQLDVSTGQILEHNDVHLDEAVKGTVARPPTPLPVLDRR